VTLTLTLLAPLGLAALVALGVPILIHLVRRIELRTTDFAALRWISDRIRPRRRIRFERPWLLALRLLLLALVALLLARPVLDEPPLAQRARVVVAPGADMSAARAGTADAGADWRWLAPGFPSIESPAPSESVPVASLLRELDADLPRDTPLTVIVPAELAGLDGERAVLSRAIDWRVVPGRMADAAATKASAPSVIAVRYAAASEPALKYIRATVDAWNVREPGRYTLDAQEDSVAVGADARWLIWLGPDIPANVAAWIEQGGTALVANRADASGTPVWRDANGEVVAQSETRGRGRVIALPGAFEPATLPALLDADFPTQLHELLQGSAPPPTRAPASAVQPVSGGDAADASATVRSTKPLDPWLALLIAILFLAERAVATRERAPA
jgi:hypothetical protein